MSESGNCKKCGAYILWVDTQNGKRMPLDKEPERRYVLQSATVNQRMMATQRNTFTCHFDTCKGTFAK